MARTISEEEVRHIALLGRLNLSDDEVALFARELAAVLDYVEQLKEVDVEGVEPTAHVAPVENVFRNDEVKPSIGAEASLANAPQQDRSMFKVPKVLDQ